MLILNNDKPAANLVGKIGLAVFFITAITIAFVAGKNVQVRQHCAGQGDFLLYSPIILGNWKGWL